jgi:hypothetical protein
MEVKCIWLLQFGKRFHADIMVIFNLPKKDKQLKLYSLNIILISPKYFPHGTPK